MRMTLADVIRLVTPPAFIHLTKRLFSNRSGSAYGLSGDYHSWHEALATSTGYDSEVILQKTKAALLEVKNGKAAYERDSVLFDKIQYSWPLLAGLLWVAAQSGGELNVLDFGGSLGSTYFQNRLFLSALARVRWNIVEQPRYVEVGRALFADDRLHFYFDLAGCLAQTQPNVALFSSVLQYIEHPYAMLDRVLELPCDHLIIDRTPFWPGPTDRLCVQTVPPSIYPARYPCWVFSATRFRAYLGERWHVIAEFDSIDKMRAPVRAVWQGFILERTKPVRLRT